ncbi:hypothetical protein QTP86_010797 [Hemibagrus guttatus]|nr:hypothetical protein QTP86_010797 [Hemibagrus guttatus]
MPSRRFRADTITEKKDGYKSNNIHGKLQNREDVAETLELSIALEKLLQQSHKSVAVVPPISQQVPSPEKKDHGTKTCNDGLPFKIEAVWTLVKEGKNMENDSNAPNLPKGVIEELLQFSGPHAETQESNKHKDESTVNSLISDTPSADVPQSKVGSATSRGPVCSTVLTAETPEDHNKVKTGESNCNIVDLSKVEVLNFTMENFNNWVKSLDDQPERSIKGQEADVKKHLLDLFWDGKVQNLEKQVHMFPSVLFGVFSQVSREEMQRAVFQYLQPEDLSKLAHGYHILKNNTNLPTEEFRSSWLNIDGQPAEIENILAEPISDLNLTTYALPAGFNTLDDYSEFELSTEVIHAATDCQNDKMVNKELAKSQVCESKSNDKISNTQEPSKKHEDGNLEKHQQQNGNMSPEESEASNEKEDTLSKIKRTECEQDGIRKSVTSSKTSSESVEQRDLSNDPNSNSDSELIKVSLLSPDDTRTIFKEQSCCDLQKEPSQLCQDETQDSGTPNNDSKDFCSSSKLIKFTCPHVANTDWNGEHFCPMCWEATPLLDLDMEEALFSPRGSSPNMRSPPTQSPHDQSCSSQSGNPDSNCTASSESSSIACSPTPKDAVSEVTLSVPDLNPGDAVQSYAQNLESPVVPVQPKTPRDSKNRLFKKSKLSKSKKNPVNDTFTADLVNKKASSKKPHPSDLTVTPAEDDQNCRDERKERGEERNPLIKQKIQSNAPQPDKPEPNVNVCSESSGDSSPSTNGVNMSFADPDPDLEDSNQSSNSPDKESELSAKSPDKEAHRQVHSESVKLTMAIVEEECEAQCLTEKIEKRKNVTSSLTTEARRTASPPRYPPCKKVKVRTVSMPDDDLFTPDIVVKKASTPNPHLNNLNATPSEEVQHPFKDERNKKGEERKSPLKSHCEQQSVQTKTDTWEETGVLGGDPRGTGRTCKLHMQRQGSNPQPWSVKSMCQM